MPRPHGLRADLVVGFVLFLFLGTFALAAIEVTNERSARIRCASNLRQIGQAMLLYSNDNESSLPRVKYEPDKPIVRWGTPYSRDPNLAAADKPEEADPFAKESKYAPRPNDVTAALFLLLRTQDISPQAFICPSTGQTPLDYGAGNNPYLMWTNWNGDKAIRNHLSYSMSNPYPTKEVEAAGYRWDNTRDAAFALAADMNPGVNALTKLNLKSSPLAITMGNSINHGRLGQNVLYADGHVEWVISSFVGIKRDNIYTYGNSGDRDADSGGEGVAASPESADDSVMLPPADLLEMVDSNGKISQEVEKRRQAAAAGRKPAPEPDANAVQKRLIGRYVREEAGKLLTLDVTEDAIIAAAPGAVNVKFSYRIEGARDEDSAYVLMRAPDAAPTIAHVQATEDGIYFYQGQQADGSWKRH